jgi:hypothetical protein
VNRTLDSSVLARGLAPQIMLRDRWVPDALAEKRRAWTPKTALGRVVRDCLDYLPAEMAAELLDKISSVVVLESSLRAIHHRYDERSGLYVLDDYGVIGTKVITDAGVAYLVDAWENIVELETMKYHGVGTGTTAEAASQTALVTESTTALNPDSTRATGSLTETSAPVFATVGTLTFDATAATTEHGLFSQAATGGGTMWDRTMYSASTINVASGDSIQFTYSMTASSGG